MSYGATVGLGALPYARNLRRAVLYDPLMFVGDKRRNVEGLQPLLREDGEATTIAFYRAVLGDDDPRLDQLPALARDPRLPATLPREAIALDEWTLDPGSYVTVDTPLLFIAGSDSPHSHTIGRSTPPTPHSRTAA